MVWMIAPWSARKPYPHVQDRSFTNTNAAGWPHPRLREEHSEGQKMRSVAGSNSFPLLLDTRQVTPAARMSRPLIRYLTCAMYGNVEFENDALQIWLHAGNKKFCTRRLRC